MDVTDNELSYVEAIHCFVEMLDRYFGNVCELDLVFNFHKAYTILDEFILAGASRGWPRPRPAVRVRRPPVPAAPADLPPHNRASGLP